MPTRLLHSFVMFLVAACAVVAPACPFLSVRAQEVSPAEQTSDAPSAKPESSSVVGRVSARLERGGHVSVDNFTTGRIRVVGWDRETVEATATSDRGGEAIKIRLDDTPAGRRIFLDTAFSDEGEFRPAGEGKIRAPERLSDQIRLRAPGPFGDRDPAPAATPKQTKESATSKESAPPLKVAPPNDGAKPKDDAAAAPPKVAAQGGPPKVSATPAETFTLTKPFITPRRKPEIHIEVHVPRYALLEPLRVFRSPVEITGVETHVKIVGDRSEIRLKDVGGASVETKSGRVSVEDARGDVDVLTVSGDVAVRDVRGDVRARTLSGALGVACVSGKVEAGSAEGPVVLAGVGGDVDANTTGGPIRLAAAVREGGSYRLKSMTGRVEMALAGRAPGFTVTLSSYTGQVETDRSVETDISLQIQEDTTSAESNRRRVGRHGDGRAQISLDSFDGTVRLTRAASTDKVCR